MIINRENVNEIVNKSGTKPDKDYGQNFLVDFSAAEKIVDALELGLKDDTLEIGPGLGSLTHFLYKKSSLTVCDIDSRMINFLKGIYEDIEYITDDIRKVDVSGYTKIIGNLPYNITTELVTYLLINAKNCKKMVLMCQQEAFSRFFDVSGGNYGPVSVLIHLLGESKHFLTVKPGAFYPAPKCNSSVFTFVFKDEIDRNQMINVYKMTKVLFINRRKTIYNNLKNYTKNNELALSILEKLNIEPNKRPEELSPNIYLEMYNLLKK